MHIACHACCLLCTPPAIPALIPCKICHLSCMHIPLPCTLPWTERHLWKHNLPTTSWRAISITRMHFSKMRTNCWFTVSQGGGLHGIGVCPLHADPHLHTDRPSMENSLPKTYPSLQRQTPHGQTDACENITFPHTTYAVGNNPRTCYQFVCCVDVCFHQKVDLPSRSTF